MAINNHIYTESGEGLSEDVKFRAISFAVTKKPVRSSLKKFKNSGIEIMLSLTSLENVNTEMKEYSLFGFCTSPDDLRNPSDMSEVYSETFTEGDMKEFVDRIKKAFGIKGKIEFHRKNFNGQEMTFDDYALKRVEFIRGVRPDFGQKN